MFPGEMHFGNGSFPLVIFDKIFSWFYDFTRRVSRPSQTVTIAGNEKRHWDFYRKQILWSTEGTFWIQSSRTGVSVLDWILWTLLRCSRVFYWVLNVRVEICRGCCWFRHIHAHILFHADVSNPNTAVSTWSSFVMLMSLLSVQVMLTAWSSERVEAGPVRWSAVWWCSTVMRELNQLVLLSAPRGVHVLQMFCFSWTAAWSDCGEASGMS